MFSLKTHHVFDEEKREGGGDKLWYSMVDALIDESFSMEGIILILHVSP